MPVKKRRIISLNPAALANPKTGKSRQAANARVKIHFFEFDRNRWLSAARHPAVAAKPVPAPQILPTRGRPGQCARFST
jgi:hypothetical protein